MAKGIKETVRKAWSALRQASEREAACPFALEHCEVAAIAVEKGHRKFMSGHGSGYTLTVTEAARLSVLQNVYDKRRAPKSWQDAATTRRDIALCQALRERLVDQKRMKVAFPDVAFMAIDYAEHVAMKATGS